MKRSIRDETVGLRITVEQDIERGADRCGVNVMMEVLKGV